MKALIDLDLVVYRVGNACDNWHYIYMGERYDSQKELKAYLKQSGLDPDFLEQAVRERDPESWEDTRDSVVSFVEDLVEPYEDYQGFISGKGNFRYQVATILPYKGNRTGLKPTHYDAIRQLLVESYDAEVTVGIEADDALGMAQTEDTVIVSLDKDLDMIPGMHYNWEKDMEYEISEREGIVKFYQQLLTGDSTDNILGLYGVGKSSKLLKNVAIMESYDEMYAYVYDQYKARFGDYGAMFMEENAKLLWILQSRENPVLPGDEYWR